MTFHLTMGVPEACSLCDALVHATDGSNALPPSALDCVAAHTALLAFTPRGSNALQRVFRWANEWQRPVLMMRLEAQLPIFALDSFANYYVQVVFEFSSVSAVEALARSSMAGHLLTLSVDKYGSNVVQALLRKCATSSTTRRMASCELLYNVTALRTLLNDGYGNFVLQTLIETVQSPAELWRVRAQVEDHVTMSPYRTNIMAKLTKRHVAFAHARLSQSSGWSSHSSMSAAYDVQAPPAAQISLAGQTAGSFFVAPRTLMRCDDVVFYRHNPYASGVLF